MSIENQLANLAAVNSHARAILAYKAEKPRSRELPADTAWGVAGLPNYWAVLPVLRAIAEAGGGRFVIGRGGYKTRLEWAHGVDFAAALDADAEDATAPEADAAAPNLFSVIAKARAMIADAAHCDAEAVKIQLSL